MPPDPVRGMQLVRAAAERGDARAQGILGEVLDRGGLGQAKDVGQAVSWLEKAAAQGDAVAQRDYAIHLQRGDGVAADPARALALLSAAAAKGDAKAQLAAGGGESPAASRVSPTSSSP